MADPKIRAIFDKLDADKSGQISVKVMVDFLRQAEAAQNPGLSDKDLGTIAQQKAFHILLGGNKNEDSKITFEEIFRLLKDYMD